jgi:Sulfotransferase family
MTIISNSRNFLFVHVPKTAGTSVTHLLSSYTRWNDIELGGTQFGEQVADLYRIRFGIGKHTKISRIREIVGDETFRKLFKFGFVRNPYARIFSAYRHLKRWRAWGGSEIMDSFSSFDEFIQSRFFQETSGPDDLFEPQFRWLCQGSGPVLVDYIGKVESLSDSVSHIFEKLAVQYDEAAVPLKNQSGDPNEFRSVYSSRAIEIVVERYERDFELFTYDKTNLRN